MASMSVLDGINSASLNTINELLKNSNNDETSLYTNYGANTVLKNNSAAAKALGQYENNNSALTSSVSQAAIKRAISELKEQGEDFISFSKLSSYQKDLEEEFTLKTRAELYMLGVDLETNFDLTMDANGNISVACDDPMAKATIEKYLEDNPKVCEDFGYIQALANVERARQSPATLGTALRNSQAEINSTTLAAFLNQTMNSGTMDYSSLTAKFGISTEDTQFYAGLNFTV